MKFFVAALLGLAATAVKIPQPDGYDPDEEFMKWAASGTDDQVVDWEEWSGMVGDDTRDAFDAIAGDDGVISKEDMDAATQAYEQSFDCYEAPGSGDDQGEGEGEGDDEDWDGEEISGQELFKLVDTDGDGLLSMKEALGELLDGLNEEELEAMEELWEEMAGEDLKLDFEESGF